MKNPQQPIRLKLQTSVCLSGFISISHLLAAIAPYFIDAANLIRWSLLALVMLSWYLLWNKLISRSSASSILQATWQADDSWLLVGIEGQVQQARSWDLLLNTPALIMLSFQLNTHRSAILLICPDSIHPEVSRQLRVRLNTR